jgi:hypothetical protein
MLRPGSANIAMSTPRGAAAVIGVTAHTDVYISGLNASGRASPPLFAYRDNARFSN